MSPRGVPRRRGRVNSKKRALDTDPESDTTGLGSNPGRDVWPLPSLDLGWGGTRLGWGHSQCAGGQSGPPRTCSHQHPRGELGKDVRPAPQLGVSPNTCLQLEESPGWPHGRRAERLGRPAFFLCLQVPEAGSRQTAENGAVLRGGRKKAGFHSLLWICAVWKLYTEEGSQITQNKTRL